MTNPPNTPNPAAQPGQSAQPGQPNQAKAAAVTAAQDAVRNAQNGSPDQKAAAQKQLNDANAMPG